MISKSNIRTHWAELPVAIKNGAGAKVGHLLYVGLGSAGQAWYGLDTRQPGAAWTALAEFPDAPRDAASAVAVDGQIYVFAGSGKAQPTDAAPQIFDTVYQYDPAQNTWRQLPTRTPMGVLAAAAVCLDQTHVLFFGGVNKAVFEGYCQDYFIKAADNPAAQAELSTRYFEQRPQDYLWTAQVLSFNTRTLQWRNLGLDPQLPTVGSMLAVQGQHLSLINGEIKPGLRSPRVKTVAIDGENLSWGEPSPLIAPSAQTEQEGIAGGVGGYHNGALLLAGGANFPGAWQQYRSGQNYAHKGLKKTWRDEIYAQVKGQWQLAGRLSAPMGYGNYFEIEDGILVVGGELQDGAPSKDVFLMQWNGQRVDIVR